MDGARQEVGRSNRTFMELKLLIVTDRRMLLRSNRTFMELK